MITLLFAAVLVVIVVVALAAARGGPFAADTAYVRWSWVPAAALALEYAFSQPLVRALSYFAVVLPLLTCFVSLALGVVGVVLVGRARAQGQPTRPLAIATTLAALPVVVVVAYILTERARRHA